MNFPNKITVNDDIKLELFNMEHMERYFESIHELKEEDEFRNNLKNGSQT
jgi:hypothetical protein